MVKTSALHAEDLRFESARAHFLSDVMKFYKLSIEERIDFLKKKYGLSDEEINILKNTGSLTLDIANVMIENTISVQHIPLGIATNFVIDGKNYLIPMATEEPSVIAAASYAAKLSEGFFVIKKPEPITTCQIEIINPPDDFEKKFEKNKEEIINKVKELAKRMEKYGGGYRGYDLIVNKKRAVVYFHINTSNAMGANVVNAIAEKIAPIIQKYCGGEIGLRILTNSALKRVVKIKAIWKKEKLDLEKGNIHYNGEKVIDGIIKAWEFANENKDRAITHNKGIMNGVDAVVIATGNDFRAVEAGAHAYACKEGYKPLTKYYKNDKGDLVGEIELPIAVGTVGGSIKTNPIAKICLKILGNPDSIELAEIIASVGLANNFAALRALSMEGIQMGHMKLHAKNLAVLAGAKGEEILKVSEELNKRKIYTKDEAIKILEEIRNGNNK